MTENHNREGILDRESTASGTALRTKPGGERLGVYVDTVVDADHGDDSSVRTNAASLAFLTFVCEVGSDFSGLSIFARQSSDAGTDFPLPGGPVVAGLPYYPTLSPGALATNAFATARAMWRHLDDVDHVWVFGPHPFGLLLVALARVRRRRVTLGVRQETLAYFASRMKPGARHAGVALAVRILDASWRLLSRRLPTTVVGAGNEKAYGGPRTGLYPMSVSLIRRRDLRPVGPRRELTEPIELLTVGRLSPEKNPMMLLDALAMLHSRRPDRFRLTWVGDGELQPAVRDRVAELGLQGVVSLPGFVPIGHELMEYYRRSDLFVLTSVTEGLPQVLIEAQANALPIVATDVGGVGVVLDNGRAGALVPSGDPAALAESIDGLVTDSGRRAALVSRGRELAEMRTLEETSASTAAFLAAGTRQEAAA
ncbi:glycosyltransferase [Paractinoplanes lichenicola]|uniref:Glycosyltransferase family 4 protein n=1 Tax=Paractinoplanes lichenicola TaxID=2802976 RepID=A0ABS1W6F7_9ACTN|nr:glycosyltransferase [Actinoplanes lichenicola]MBL7262303.1 glycosyltransferase family 4 protein [Actinoplanes lichenicola]